MANRFRQFRLLLWKNFILQIRRPVGTVFEILLPILLVAILILPKVFLEPTNICFDTFEPTSSLSIPSSIIKQQTIALAQEGKILTANQSLVLAYYPLGDPVASLMRKVSQTTGIKAVNYSVVHGEKEFTSLDQIIAEATEHEDRYFGVVVFDLNKGDPLPKKVKYSIRLSHSSAGDRKTWLTERTYPNFQTRGARKDNFYLSRFVPLQYAIDMAIIQEKSNLPTPIPMNVQQLPYPSYVQDPFVQTVSGLLPFMVTLAFIYSAVSIIKEIVFEKQQRLKESMKMMGLENWLHWLAWYTKCLLFLLISVILVTLVIKVFKIFEYSDGFIVFLFFLIYAAASISYCFFISVFFSNPTLSMLFGLALWYASLLPYQIFAQNQNFDLLSKSAKAAMCLLPNSALGIASTLFARLEGLKLGMTFETINQSTSPDDTFNMAWVFMMMIISAVMFMILAWYIEGVFPGKYGIPKPFYFPFQKSYWCGFSHDDIIEANATDKELGPVENKDQDHHAVEDEPTDLQIGVGIKGLRKVFKSSAGTKVAVDGLSLNMYKGQITALLGHNGAGKTTTMSILTGLFPPTSGSAHIGNKSILTDIDGIRESLGLCPQHNVLFDRLTVKEHLEFFINLKGKYGQAAKDEVLAMITDMQLLDKMNEKSATLSGGMKRKLSCAIALVGGSETVFLDEPTSGMDPYARRATWDLLLKYKAGKTIILTTHFMDEADFLGDRIAIMADGQLRCCGSSLFLKSRYGVGYHLTLVKEKDFNENTTINTVKRFVPSAEILSSVGAELEMVLNKDAAKSFENLFLDLETKKQEYGIASFGVSVTTMEEVFMKVGEGAEKTVDDIVSDHEHHKDTENIVTIPNETDPDMGELQKGFAHKWQQYKAMLVKRFLNSKRDKKAVVTQLIMPLVMVLFGLIIINSNPARDSDLPRLLKLSNLSVGGVNSKAFFGYFRDVNASTKASYLSAAKDFLSTVKVDTIDVTDSVNTIQSKNTLNGIQVQGTSYNYSSPVKDKLSPCCNYEFLILNAKCQKDFTDKSLKASNCSSNEMFGYKSECDTCLTQTKLSCNPKSIQQTILSDKNTYFIEHVLEESDSKDFFNKHVAGFTIGPMTYTVIAPTNMSGGNMSSSNVSSGNSSLPTNKTGPVTTMPPNPSTLWYSNQAFHTVAEALNAMSNIFLRELTSKEHEIETTNFPLPNTAKNKSENVTGSFSMLFMAIFLAMGMAYMAASFIAFLVQERASKAKHLQFVSGVDSFCYWFGTYTWDYLNYLIPALFVLVIFAAFQVESYKNDMGAVFLLLILFGMAVLPFVYVMSFLFKSPLVAYALTVFILSILSLAMLLTVFICRLPGVDLEEEAEIMHYVFMIFPTYTLSISLVDMNSNYENRKICTETPENQAGCAFAGVKYTDSSLSWEMPGVGQEVLFMFIEGIVLFIVTLIIQSNFLMSFQRKKSQNSANSQKQPTEDEDVYAERMRIAQLNKEQSSKQAVVMKDLTKIYRGSNMVAVNHLNLGIPRGECFGLLGVNGAGKTSTFSMLTGDQSISDGTAFLDGYDIQTHLKQVQQRIGYCPQFDALIERMTGREMLVMYAQLRGVAPDKIDEVVSATIDHLSLGKWADKLCGNYSGGNKRKLSTAIALVGNPPIVFLDEPTSGMDPVARRFLWDSLTSVMKGGRSIILTSHSMEECEALCTRLAIMVNGQFKCIGSPQHLKSRFGYGYSLMIKVKGDINTNGSIATASEVIPQVPSVPSAAYTNPVATQGLPSVHGPGHPPYNAVANQNPPANGDVAYLPPPPPVAPPNLETIMLQPPAVYYDNGLMEAVQKAQAFIDQAFPGATLMESHNGMLTYQIVNEDLTWSQIFGQLERNRESLNIIDYSVSQTTLEQVFINFAKHQHSEERTKVKKCRCFPC
ncbi:ATP-binding cassette sub-family A member 3-like [Actinia tenebrosa]|uniref:ATP-binding cassette sub-family A member 3-like n=1 Tax=Actinia tenebrosa TaxID=6105 RepID=A0A6P8I141_ACTTE|nr:ATP-binding cassette sub-family A member 3-like [Actinia tenebrosa]